MTIIWIRHADDEYLEQTFRHDCKIVGSDIQNAKQLYERIVKVYGEPDRVFCSAFRRTKMTAIDMGIPGNRIEYDSRLSRYFASKEKSKPEVSSHTARILTKEVTKKIIDETYDEFKARVRSFRRSIGRYRSRYNEQGKRQLVLCITHTLVIKEIAKRYKITFPDFIPFLFTLKTPYKIIIDNKELQVNTDNKKKQEKSKTKR